METAIIIYDDRVETRVRYYHLASVTVHKTLESAELSLIGYVRPTVIDKRRKSA